MKLDTLGKSLLATAFLCALAVHGQNSGDPPPAAPPSAEAILDRYVEVTGGRAAYDRIENRVTQLTVSRDGEPLWHVTAFQTRAGDFREIGVAGDKTMEIGVNAGVPWTKTAESAELIESGEERARILRDAVLMREGRWRTFYTKTGWESSVMLGGRSCHQLAVTPFAGEAQRLWFDARTGLLVKQEVPEPEGLAEFTFDDYFDTGGVRVARKQTVRIGDVTLLMTVDRVQYNQAIPASTFQPPEEIARLLEKRAAR